MFTLFFWSMGFSIPLDMLVAKWVPTPCYNDAYSVGTPRWAFREKGWQKYSGTTFSPPYWAFLFGKQKDILFFLGGYLLDVAYWKGQASWAWPL